MKTKKTNLATACIMIFISLISLGSCKNKQEEGVKESNASEVSETKASAPSMDIHTATFMGDLNAIKQHIAAGSDLDAKDQYGSTPLTVAATFGKTEVAKELIMGGADINAKSGDGSTPLHTASFFCRTEIVQALLEKGADKTIKNNYGSTALESVSAPYKDVKVFYEQIAKQLGPLGLKLDFERIEKTRPVIAEMIK